MSRETIFQFTKDGKFWVDTGHADVGPFDTKKDAKAHIDRIIADKERRARERNVQFSKSND